MQTYCPRGREEKNFSELRSSFDAMGSAAKEQRTKFRCWLPPNKKLAKEFVDFAQSDCELVGVVVGRHFELLEKAVDGGADFGGVGGLRFFAIRDIERIERHRRLLGCA